MTGRYTTGPNADALNMALGSPSLTLATCASATQGCCDNAFGKMIGGMSKISLKYFFHTTFLTLIIEFE